VLTQIEPIRDAPTVDVVLQVPKDMEYQLVFRQQRGEPFPVGDAASATFHFCRGLAEYLALFWVLRRAWGWGGAIKGALKILTPKRLFYCFTDGGELLHSGWIMQGTCRQYHIEPTAAVIGPIWTSPLARGKGLATIATQSAMNELLGRGPSVFYIDTANTNSPCLKVIERCEFGAPIASYIRP
jgi:hypothetical protein